MSTDTPRGGRGGRRGGPGGGRGGHGGRRRGGDRFPDGPTPGSGAADAPPADPETVAREVCLRLLTMSPRTRSQLAEALQRKNVPEDVAERVLGRFSEVGLIDDAAFAQSWVESRHRGRGLAGRALAAELRQRGVDDETVQEAVAALDPDQEESRARELVDRRLASTRGIDPVRRMRKLVGMLARKGYSPGLAYRVVKDALADEGADVEDFPEDGPEE
ncbi:MAG: regulatory protein [Streptosporangiaceae bacterium]|jgi:regulatory protein|nr:regulatory protein [Streptosporangiaceae bacterium]